MSAALPERSVLSPEQHADVQALVDYYVRSMEEGNRGATVALVAISQVLLVLGYTLGTSAQRRWCVEAWRP